MAFLLATRVAEERPGGDGTRRVDPSPPEQQDRLGEQLGAQTGDSQYASRSFDQEDKDLAGRLLLLGSRSEGEQRREGRRVNVGIGSGDKSPEANQNARLRGGIPHQDGPMAKERGQVQNPRRQAPDPLAQASRRNIVGAGYGRDCGTPIGFHDGIHHVGDVIDLAGKQVAGQDPLPRPTDPTTGQPDRDPPIGRGRVHRPLNPATGQGELIAAAAGANTVQQNRVNCARQNLGVPDRLHGKYVAHRVPRRPRSHQLHGSGPFFFPLVPGLNDRGKGTGRREGGRSNPTGCDSHRKWGTTT